VDMLRQIVAAPMIDTDKPGREPKLESRPQNQSRQHGHVAEDAWPETVLHPVAANCRAVSRTARPCIEQDRAALSVSHLHELPGKTAIPLGPWPTGMVRTTAWVTASITETLSSLMFVT